MILVRDDILQCDIGYVTYLNIYLRCPGQSTMPENLPSLFSVTHTSACTHTHVHTHVFTTISLTKSPLLPPFCAPEWIQREKLGRRFLPYFLSSSYSRYISTVVYGMSCA